jgi:hypothetical protein
MTDKSFFSSTRSPSSSQWAPSASLISTTRRGHLWKSLDVCMDGNPIQLQLHTLVGHLDAFDVVQQAGRRYRLMP